MSSCKSGWQIAASSKWHRNSGSDVPLFELEWREGRVVDGDDDEWTDGLAFMDRAIAAASVMLLWMLLLRGMAVRRGIRRGADLHRGGR